VVVEAAEVGAAVAVVVEPAEAQAGVAAAELAVARERAVTVAVDLASAD
jgi:hypothetical protein